MIKNKKHMLIVIAVFTVIVLLCGVAYALFNYARIGEDSTLVVGNIYMNHTEGTTINLVNESPCKQEKARSRTDNSITIQIFKNYSTKFLSIKLYIFSKVRNFRMFYRYNFFENRGLK